MRKKFRLFTSINNLDSSRKRLPLYLCLLLSLYGLLSSIMAHFHILAKEKNWTKIASSFAETSDGTYTTIRKIWMARMLRRSLSLFLRTPLRYGCTSLVDCKIDVPHESGCIIAICHTPWARLLAEWCRVNNFGLVLVGGPWIQRTGQVNIPGGGFVGLRKLVRHLHSGGKVIVMGDTIGRSRCCAVNFFGKESMASVLPARLASLAGVPLLAIAPKLEDGMVTLQNGLTLGTDVIYASQDEVMQRIFSFFEDEILCSPSIWAPYILQSQNRMSSYSTGK